MRRSFVQNLVTLLCVSLLVALFLSYASAQEPRRGGRAIIALIQEPGQMNRFFNTQSGSWLSALVQEPLFRADADGQYHPFLAADIPTVANGGVSEDFLTVTYRLREGITWSDGQPFTADDIVFTWEVYSDPGAFPSRSAAMNRVESVTMIDELTVEVTMNEVNPEYLSLWEFVLPRHMFESSAVTREHPQALMPLGTGPFVFTEWRSGELVRLDRNPNYWLNPEKPYLDGITAQITPDRNTALASFVAGQFDLYHFVISGDIPTLRNAVEQGRPIVLEVDPVRAGQIEWLYLNVSNQGDLSTPHPVLGDLAIRQALDYAVDRQSIIDDVLEGAGVVASSLINRGWAEVQIPPTAHDLERASQILDEAGWVRGADGIRSKDGVRASLRFMTTAGDRVRELYQQLIQQNLLDVGIEVRIDNQPASTIYGSYEEGGRMRRGDFDILMGRSGAGADPSGFIANFTTELIPSAENPGGTTFTFYSNPEFDARAAEAAATLDQEIRFGLYRELAEMFAAELPAIPLYALPKAGAWNERLRGVDMNFFLFETPHLYSAADWYLAD